MGFHLNDAKKIGQVSLDCCSSVPKVNYTNTIICGIERKTLIISEEEKNINKQLHQHLRAQDHDKVQCKVQGNNFPHSSHCFFCAFCRSVDWSIAIRMI